MTHAAADESFLDEIARMLDTTEAAVGQAPLEATAPPLADDLALLLLSVDEDELFAVSDAITDVGQQEHGHAQRTVPPSRSVAQSRLRQREELEYLRDQVQELEGRLETLRHEKRPDSPAASPPNISSAAPREDAQKMVMLPSVVWERIAKNQMSAKQKVEIENAKLREMLHGQLKIARGLERVLRKRSSLQIDTATLATKRRRRIDSTDANIYEQLKLRLDARYRNVEAAFQQNRLCTNRSDLEDVRVLSTGDARQLSVEILFAKVLPFDFASTSAAVWACSSTSYLQLTEGYYAAQAVSDDELTAQFEIPLILRRQSVTLYAYVALKRYRETNQREVHAWESWSIVQSSHKAFNGIQLLDHGWTVVQSLAPHDPACPATIVQSCSRIVPDEQSLPRHSPIGVLNDVLIASYNRNYATLIEIIENTLLNTRTCLR